MTPEDLVDAQAVLAYMKDPNSIGQFNVETLMAAMQLWVENDKKKYVRQSTDVSPASTPASNTYRTRAWRTTAR